MTRCEGAGIIIKEVFAQRGKPSRYIIEKNEMYLEGEVWKECYCDSNLEVSNLGRIRRIRTKKLLGHNTSGNYTMISTVNPKGERKHYTAQRLVFFTFHPELVKDADALQIDHINGIRRDNRLENLRALTNIDNTLFRDKNQGMIRSLETEIIALIGYDALKIHLEDFLLNIKKSIDK